MQPEHSYFEYAKEDSMIIKPATGMKVRRYNKFYVTTISESYQFEHLCVTGEDDSHPLTAAEGKDFSLESDKPAPIKGHPPRFCFVSLVLVASNSSLPF